MVRLLIITLLVELFILFLICLGIFRIAETKKLNSTKYITTTILLWFGLQALFYVAGLLLFKFIQLAFLFSLIGAAVGGLLAYRIAKKATEPWSKYEEVE